MIGVCSTPRAVLGEFQALFRVGLILGRHVVAMFARLASQRDGRSFVRGHSLVSFGFAEPGREFPAQELRCSDELFDHLRDEAGTDGAATFTNGELEAFFHGNRSDEFHGHFRVVARHNHFGTCRQGD